MRIWRRLGLVQPWVLTLARSALSAVARTVTSISSDTRPPQPLLYAIETEGRATGNMGTISNGMRHNFRVLGSGANLVLKLRLARTALKGNVRFGSEAEIARSSSGTLI